MEFDPYIPGGPCVQPATSGLAHGRPLTGSIGRQQIPMLWGVFVLLFLGMLFCSCKYGYMCYCHEMAWGINIFMRFVVITGVLYGLTRLFDRLSTEHPEI